MNFGIWSVRHRLIALCALAALVPAFDALAPPKTPPTITSQPQSDTVVAGDAASFSVTATGSTPLYYQWRKNGTPISGATAATYSLAAVTINDAAGYDVVVSNAYGTATSSTATLTVWVPPAIVTQPQSRTNVFGTDASFTVTASGTPPPTCQWQFNGAAIPGATGTTLLRSAVSFADAGGYRAVLNNVAGTVTSAVATLTVVCPAVTVSPATLPDGQVGSAYNQSLTASGGLGTYTFTVAEGSLPAGLTLSSAGVLSGTPGAVGTSSFTVRATDTYGCFGSQAYSLVVKGVPPAITLQPQSRTNVVGTDASFSVTASGTPPPAYQWQFNGAAIPGATGSSLTRSAVSFADAGSYTAVASNVAGSATSAVATLTVVCPAVTLSPSSLPGGTVGSPYSQSLSAGGGAAPYTYSVTSGSLPPGLALSGAGLLSGTPTTADNFSFVVRATDASGCSGSQAYSLGVTVIQTPPAITAQPMSLVVSVGANVSFGVSASGTAPLSYQWRFNGTDLASGGQYSGATATTLSISNVQLANAGSYVVVVTNALGSVASAVATLTVIPPPACVANAQGLVGWWPGDGNANDIAGGNAATLQGTATASGSGIVGSAFTFDGTNGYAQIPDSPVLRPTNLTVEAWVLFRSLESAGSGGTPVGQQYIVFKQNTRTSFFEGYSLTKMRTASGDVFAFAASSALGQIAEVRSTSLVATGVWYHVAGVRGSNFVQLYVNGTPESQTAATFAQDYGNLPLYFGTSGQTSWDRKLNGRLDEVSLYSRALSSDEIAAVYQIGAGGKCKAASITLQPQSQAVAAGSSAVFTVAATGFGSLSYQWRFNGVNLAGATGTSLTLANVQPANVGSYTVVVTNSLGSATSTAATLTVWVPPVIATQPQSRTNGVGTVATFSVLATGTEPLGYQWQYGGVNLANNGRITGATTDVLQIADVQTGDAGAYRVVVSNAGGVVTSTAASLTVTASQTTPVITAQPASLMVSAGANVNFTVAASGAEPLSYQWRFNGMNLANGGAYSGATTPTLSIGNVQPANAGSYTVVVTNLAGAVTSATATLVVIPPAVCVPPVEGLVGWWPGEGNANDLAGVNNGALQGGATASAPGVVGSAFSFNGSTAYVQIPDAAALRPAQLTIETWVRVDALDTPAWGGSPAGDQYLVFKQNTHAASFEGFALIKTRVGSSDFFDFLVSAAGGQSAEVTSVSTIATGVWYHVAAVRGSDYLQLYVNGQLEAQTGVSFPQDYGAYPLYLGSSGQPSWDHRLAGALDEVSLYNRALSSGEIAAIYAAHAGGKCRAPTITAQPQGRTLPPGSNVSFTVSATGSLPLVYQWQRDGLNLADGGNISGAFSPTLSLVNVAPDDAGSYRVIITNTAGAATSAVAVLAVASELVPPSIIGQPVSQTAATGAKVNFTVVVSGTAPFSYQWRFNGTNLPNGGAFSGATSATLAINSVLPADSGAYSVVVANDSGAVTSAVATLTVSAPTECLSPLPGLVGWWPGDGNGNDIVGANNGTLQGGATANAPAVVGTGFSLDGTNMYVEIPDAPALRPAELTVECWAKWNDLSTPGTSVYPGQQYLVFKQNSRMSDFEGYVLSKDRTWNDIILWEVTSASGQLVRIDSTSPVTTNVWYHLAGVRGSNYIQIYFNGRLEAQTNVYFPQDYGDWPLYFGTSGQSYYDRKLNGVMDEVALYNRALSASEIATLYATGAAGKCKGTNDILITAQPQSQVAAPGNNVAFTVTATGVAPMTYQWHFNGSPITGATDATLALPAVQIGNAGTYKVVISNPTGTKASADAILMVTGAPLLVHPRTTPEGAFAFTLIGTPGHAYVIEVTTNLQQWAPLASLTNSSGQTDFTDTSSATNPSRFYRARQAD